MSFLPPYPPRSLKSPPNSKDDFVYLDNVTEELIGLGVLCLDLLELVAEAEGVGLELEVGVLASRDLVVVHVSISRPTRGAIKRVSKELLKELPMALKYCDKTIFLLNISF